MMAIEVILDRNNRRSQHKRNGLIRVLVSGTFEQFAHIFKRIGRRVADHGLQGHGLRAGGLHGFSVCAWVMKTKIQKRRKTAQGRAT